MKAPIFQEARKRLSKIEAPWKLKLSGGYFDIQDRNLLGVAINVIKDDASFIAAAPTDLERALKVIDVLWGFSKTACACVEGYKWTCRTCTIFNKAREIAEGGE